MSVLPTPTTPLRDQMIYAMQLHRLAPITQRIYLQAVWGLATFYRCRPDRLQPEHIRAYLHHLLVERKLSWSTCNQVAAGLQFFYTKTLNWTGRPCSSISRPAKIATVYPRCLVWKNSSGCFALCDVPNIAFC